MRLHPLHQRPPEDGKVCALLDGKRKRRRHHLRSLRGLPSIRHRLRNRRQRTRDGKDGDSGRNKEAHGDHGSAHHLHRLHRRLARHPRIFKCVRIRSAEIGFEHFRDELCGFAQPDNVHLTCTQNATIGSPLGLVNVKERTSN